MPNLLSHIAHGDYTPPPPRAVSVRQMLWATGATWVIADCGLRNADYWLSAEIVCTGIWGDEEISLMGERFQAFRDADNAGVNNSQG